MHYLFTCHFSVLPPIQNCQDENYEARKWCRLSQWHLIWNIFFIRLCVWHLHTRLLQLVLNLQQLFCKLSTKMYLMYELNENGDRIYTLKVTDTKSFNESMKLNIFIRRKVVQMASQQCRHILVSFVVFILCSPGLC